MGRGYGQKRYLRHTMQLIQSNDPTLSNVVLNGFGIVDAKLAVLAMALVGNTHVRRLHLDGNAITCRGASLLAYALQQNSTLELLSLNDNSIRDAGCEALASALGENRSLRTLRLANNGIGNHGGRRLRKALRKNRVLSEVFLDGNEIDGYVIGRFDGRCIDRSKILSARRGEGDVSADTSFWRAPSPPPKRQGTESTVDESYSSSADASAFTDASATSASAGGSEETNPSEEEDEAKQLEWAASSALSLFGGASFYMENAAAQKYIIGDGDGGGENAEGGEEDGVEGAADFDSSWTNLGSYMAGVQSAIDRREREEAAAPRGVGYNYGYDDRYDSRYDARYDDRASSHRSSGATCEEDDLSVASDVEEEARVLDVREAVDKMNRERKRKGKNRGRWKAFRKSLGKIHSK